MPVPLAAVVLDRVGGAPITIRPVTDDDVALLRDLYRRLPPEDRYFRFFSGGEPSEATLRSWIGHGGAVVAVQDGVAVADAGVVPTADGGAELGVAVDRAHRGWLGPYLVDLVLRWAGERGVAGVRADVLATNGRMLRLLRSRGAVDVPSDDPSVVKLLLGTADRVPGWPPTTKPRALVEGGPRRWRLARRLAAGGYDVVSCPGPPDGRPERCPVRRGEPCPLVAGAHLVVLSGDADAGLVEALRTVHPDATVRHEEEFEP